MHQYSHYRSPRRRREKGCKKIFEEIIAKNLSNVEKKIVEEIIAENFLNIGKEIVNQVQEAQRFPGRRNTPTHTIIKLIKLKTKIKY